MDIYSAGRTFLLAYGLILFVYYLLPAGMSYYIFYSRKRESWKNRHIQNKYPSGASIQHEIRWSMSTVLVFSFLTLIGIGCINDGLTRVYFNVDDFGWPYLVGSVLIYILVHDTYFYWFHRLLHLRPLFRVIHRTHHLSVTPSPFASLSFHPLEAVIQFGINLLMIFLIPLHPIAIGMFVFYNILLNTAGHLGYEIIPSWMTTNRLFKYGLTVTHHDMHHTHPNRNFGLCFTFWDRIMHTLHKDYENEYKQVMDQTF